MRNDIPSIKKPFRSPRKSDLFLAWTALGILLLILSFLHAGISHRVGDPALAARTDLVTVLDLTDLALFTEARYTRHPTQADLHSAFQDHPMALEHFPTGSLVPLSASGAIKP